MAEIFTIKNVSASEIILDDFGLVIPAGADVDLRDPNAAVISNQLNTFLQAGTLVRTISGNTVSYQNAFIQDFENIKVKDYSTTSGSTAPYAKIDITNGNKLVANGDYYGQHYQLYSSSGSTTNSSTTYTPKIATFFNAPTAGTYKITTSWIYSRNAANSQGYQRLTVDGIAQGVRSEMIFRVYNTAEIRTFVRVYYITLTAGQHTITLDFRNSGGSTTISDADVEIIRVK